MPLWDSGGGAVIPWLGAAKPVALTRCIDVTHVLLVVRRGAFQVLAWNCYRN